MIDSIFRILALIRKELLAVLKDPRARFTILVPPMMQCMIFGYAASFDLNDVPYAVLNQDGGTCRTTCWAGSTAPASFGQYSRSPHRQSEIARVINDRVVHSFGDPVSARLRAPHPDGARIRTAGNRRRPKFQYGWRRDAVSRHRRRIVQFGLVANTRPPIAKQSAKRSGCSDRSARAWFNPNLETRWMMIPSLIGTLTLMQTMLLTAMSVAQARAGHIRSIVGHAVPAGRDHGGQSDPIGHDWNSAGDFSAVNRPAVVSHSVRRIVCDAVPRAGLLFGGGSRHWSILVVAGGDDATGDAVFVLADSAVFAALGPHHADREYADGAAIFHVSKPAPLRDRDHPTRLPRERNASSSSSPIFGR